MKRESSVNRIAALAASLAAGAALFIASCDSGGGDGPSGKSTVQGSVASFSTATALFLPEARPSGVERFLAAVSEMIVPRARAGMGGVGVRIMGTDHQTTTADDGFFIMSGVPGGSHQMQFSFNGTNAYMQISVPDDGTLYVNGIQCRGGQAYPGQMYSMMNGSTNMYNMMNNGQNMNGQQMNWNY